MTEIGLFGSEPVEITSGMWLLPGFAQDHRLKPCIDTVCAQAPLRHMQTQRGHTMSVGMTNCGQVGWISDRRGYRYSRLDPLTGLAWPAMPEPLLELASSAADSAGFNNYKPDVCLVNRYKPGTQMGAHQDSDEACIDHPIVSVSLGIPARFFVLGESRVGKSIPVDLSDGDVIVFGEASRLCYHGVRKLKHAVHPVFGDSRWNLTFRVAQ